MKFIECPHCGVKFNYDDKRRPRLRLNSTLILSNLQKTKSVAETARQLKCSDNHIRRLLAKRGLTPNEITGRKYERRDNGKSKE